MTELGKNKLKTNYGDFLWKTLGRYDFYIGSTNTKATLLIAYNTFIIGSILLKWADIIPKFAIHPKIAIATAILMFLLASASLISMIFTFKTISPYVKTCIQPGKYHSRIFFGDVSQFESADSYYNSIINTTQDYSIEEDLAKQTYVVAKGVDKKFNDLKKAIGVLLFFQIPIICLLLIVNLTTRIIDI